MTVEQAEEFNRKCDEKGLALANGDLRELYRYGTVDGMDPYEWLDAMTMD